MESEDRFIDETYAGAIKDVRSARDKFDFVARTGSTKKPKLIEDAKNLSQLLDSVVRGQPITTQIDQQSAQNEQFKIEIEKPAVKFADFAGLQDVKKEFMKEIVLPLKNQELRKYYNKTPNGILLWGPPGSGKTELVLRAAGESGSALIKLNPADRSKFVGDSEKYVRAAFQTAKDLARKDGKCILFIDEIDALGGARGEDMQGYEKNYLAQLLIELNEAPKYWVLTIAATNSPANVDLALRRPGRFSKGIFVGPLDKKARAEFLRIMRSKIPAIRDANIDEEVFVEKTHGFVGGELRYAISAAMDRRMEFAYESGKAEPVTMEDLEYGISITPINTPKWCKQQKPILEQRGETDLCAKLVNVEQFYAKPNDSNGVKAYA